MLPILTEIKNEEVRQEQVAEQEEDSSDGGEVSDTDQHDHIYSVIQYQLEHTPI